MKRNAPILRLVPGKYDDLLSFFQAQQDIMQQQGVSVEDLPTDASLSDVITTVNELLASLRAEGSIDT